MKKLLWIAIVAGGLQGCAAAPVMVTSNKEYQRTRPEDVIIYNIQRPDHFEEIGRVSVSNFRSLTGFPRSGKDMKQYLKNQAAIMGGNGLIIVGQDLGSITGVVIKTKN